MIRNYFKIAFRNLLRHKSFSFLNIAGLAVGMAASILILLWVQNEKSYDRFHAHANEIYRVSSVPSEDFKAAVTPAAMPAELKAKFPVIKNTTRISHPSTNFFEYNDNKFEEKLGFYVDSTFFDIFSFPLVVGNVATALKRPDAILVTETMARKYFGDSDPIGKALRKNNDDIVTVTGVLKDLPPNSHLQFDYLMPMSPRVHSDIATNSWGNFNFYTYLLLDKNFTPTKENLEQFERKIDTIYKANIGATKITFKLQNLTNIHLYSHLQIELSNNGNIQYVNALSIIAFFILSVACINFMNLSTARSSRRAKEVGLRKVVGAARWQLISQFFGESIIITLLSLPIAVSLVWLSLPLFNQIAGKTLQLNFFDAQLWLGFMGIALVTGIVAGSYPALFLSGFQPITVLKGKLKLGGNLHFAFRNVLVILQFVVSIVLIVGTMVVYNQLDYIKKRNMGFEKSNLLYIPINGDVGNKSEIFRNELSKNSLTSDFTIMDDIPTNLTTGIMDVQWKGKDPNSQLVFPTLDVDDRFAAIFRMKMASGRTFSGDLKSDSSSIIINEKMAGIMGIDAEAALGTQITIGKRPATIIGVVKDFNFKPVQQAIEPIIMWYNRWPWNAKVVVRTKPGMTEATIKTLEQVYTKLNPSHPFSYYFVDQDLNNMYKSEQRLGSLFNLFAGLAIFISCLGLYGLSAFMVEQRFKEIGIRKVMGASISNVVYLLSKSYVGLILVAIAIAVPIAWYAMDSWLNGFAYRITVGWNIFAMASAMASIIAILTVSYESIRAAMSNPVKSIRNE